MLLIFQFGSLPKELLALQFHYLQGKLSKILQFEKKVGRSSQHILSPQKKHFVFINHLSIIKTLWDIRPAILRILHLRKNHVHTSSQKGRCLFKMMTSSCEEEGESLKKRGEVVKRIDHVKKEVENSIWWWRKGKLSKEMTAATAAQQHLQSSSCSRGVVTAGILWKVEC